MSRVVLFNLDCEVIIVNVESLILRLLQNFVRGGLLIKEVYRNL